MNSQYFNSIIRFNFNNKTFNLFKNKNGYAFLEYISDTDSYNYPLIDDYILLLNKFIPKMLYFNFKFVPSVKMALVSETLTLSLLLSSSVIDKNLDVNYIACGDNDSLYLSQDYRRNPIGKVLYDDGEVLQVPNLFMVYNKDCVPLFLGKKNIDVCDVKAAVYANNNISDIEKTIILDFVQTMNDYYDNLDFRLFYENIKDVRIVDIKEGNYDDAFHGCWQPKDKTIYLKRDYREDSIGIVDFRHELGHLFATGYFYDGENFVHCSFNNSKKNYQGRYIGEALNVLFTVLPFEDSYSEKVLNDDLGYRLMEKYMRCLLKIIPEYDLGQMSHTNIDYFVEVVKNSLGIDADYERLLDLFHVLTVQYLNHDLDIPKEEYSPIYDFLADAYLKYIQDNNLSDDEARGLVRFLKEQLYFSININEKKYVDYDIFETKLEKYYSTSIRK